MDFEEFSRSKIYKFDESVLERYTQAGAPNVIILLLIADSESDPCVEKFQRDINAIKEYVQSFDSFMTLSFSPSSRFVFSILFREQSSSWLAELSKHSREENWNFSPSTVLALYIRRKLFVIYSPNNHQEQQQANQSISTLTFFDWIDLLLNGNFREPITVTDWPRNFH